MATKVFSVLAAIMQLLGQLNYRERIAVIEAATALHVLIENKKAPLKRKPHHPFTLEDAEDAEESDNA
jgi:hypothetical protein